MTGPEDHPTGGGRRAADGADAERYLASVRAALDDLPPQARDDLLEDLPGHLHETSAGSGLPLERALGTPQAYAAELRSLAHGSASFTRAFARYERVPDQVSATLR